MTVNTLYPTRIKIGDGAVSTAFIQRDSICGKSNGPGLEPVYKTLQSDDWSEGSSCNIVDFGDVPDGRAGGYASVETWISSSSVYVMPDRVQHPTNASHVNKYKLLHDVPQIKEKIEGSYERQKFLDEQPGPESKNDIITLLGSSPVMRSYTIATIVGDSDGYLSIWAGVSPATSNPMYTWNIHSFFNVNHG